MTRSMTLLRSIPLFAQRSIGIRRPLIHVVAGLSMILATTAQADVNRIPVGTDRISSLVSSCLLQGGGDHPNDHQLPVFCCATNDEGARWCVACYAGTEQNPSDCSVTSRARIAAGRRLQSDAPSAQSVAPSSDSSFTRRLNRIRTQHRGTVGIIAPNN